MVTNLPIWKPQGETKALAMLSLCGAVLGLSAPGIDQFYLAWIGLVPLLIGSTSSVGIWQALCRGFFFGTAYSLVYLHWYLDLQPLDWLGFPGWQGWLLAGTAWLVVSVHQGLIISLFSLAIGKLPLSGTLIPVKSEKHWKLPALLVVPLMWILITNFIGNAHGALGVPWPMLEYSQYKQLALIQIASIIGGVGIGFLIVMYNTIIATFIAANYKQFAGASLASTSQQSIRTQLVFLVVLFACVMGFGSSKLSSNKPNAQQVVSVLQGNINIEMERTKRRYSLDDLFTRYVKMLEQCPKGLIVWTENALPAYLSDEPATAAALATFAKRHESDMVIGSMYRDNDQTPFNSAYGITGSGTLVSEVYSKRYLVPFGEYTPQAVRNFPEWILRLTNTPAGGGFGSGKTAVALKLNCGSVAPLICFETLSPELCASSVRKGGQLLVNISDLAWFHQSIIGTQMIAFSVFRAVENGRYFVFGANTGPSAIIDSNGRVLELSGQEKDLVLTGRVALSSDLTPFSQWFTF